MDRDALRATLLDGLSAFGFTMAAADALSSAHSEVLVRGLANRIERYLNIEINMGPALWAEARFLGDPELHRQSLDGLVSLVAGVVTDTEQVAPGLLDETLSLPSVRSVRARIRRYGTPSQRQALKKILAKVVRGKAGRPQVMPDDSRDVVIARMVEQAKTQLKEGFDLVRQLRNAGGSPTEDENIVSKLVEMKYDRRQIQVLRKNTTLERAAHEFVASHCDMTPGSVRVMASRGRTFLHDT